MKTVILDSATLGDDIDLSPIYAVGEVTERRATSADEVESVIEDAEVIVVNKIKLGRDNLANARALRLICVTATGYDNIDTEYCKERGIALCNVPAYSTDSVAEVTAAMALSLVCRLSEYTDFVNSGKYSASGVANRLVPTYREMSALTWGVVGGGAIGSRVAQIASALGCRVLMCRQKKDDTYENADIDTLCRCSDIISLHVPLTDSTRRLISRERIEQMKEGTILINVARGAVTDEAALADGILSGKLGGLGVDVYSTEPFGEEHPYCKLLGRPNVVLTPHMAWGALEARTRCISVIAKNITEFKNGGHLNRIV